MVPKDKITEIFLICNDFSKVFRLPLDNCEEGIKTDYGVTVVNGHGAE